MILMEEEGEKKETHGVLMELGEINERIEKKMKWKTELGEGFFIFLKLEFDPTAQSMPRGTTWSVSLNPLEWISISTQVFLSSELFNFLFQSWKFSCKSGLHPDSKWGDLRVIFLTFLKNACNITIGFFKFFGTQNKIF